MSNKIIRAKFTLNSIESSSYRRYNHMTEQNEPVVQKTLKFRAVTGNGDPESEDSKFWAATPSGILEVGCVNPEAVEHMELNSDYYIDIIPVEPAGE